MTNIELDRAIRVLGPKMVNCIKRTSLKKIYDFETKIQELVDAKRNKPTEWYKPGQWNELT